MTYKTGQRLRTAEPVAALLVGNSDRGSETGNYTGQSILVSSAGGLPAKKCPLLVESKQPFQQVHRADDNAANNKQQQSDPAEYCQLELSIALLIGRRQ
jgi:hypothetical protein